MELKKTTRLSMLVAFSVVLGLIESVLPLVNGAIPGFKLGLANSVVLATFYIYGWKEAFYISIVRVFLLGILRTGLFSITFFFSLGGAVLSVLGMTLFYHKKVFSIIGVSVIGSAFHSIGQVGMAILFLRNIVFISYVPFLILFSIPTGIIVGFFGHRIEQFLKKRL